MITVSRRRRKLLKVPLSFQRFLTKPAEQFLFEHHQDTHNWQYPLCKFFRNPVIISKVKIETISTVPGGRGAIKKSHIELTD